MSAFSKGGLSGGGGGGGGGSFTPIFVQHTDNNNASLVDQNPTATSLTISWPGCQQATNKVALDVTTILRNQSAGADTVALYMDIFKDGVSLSGTRGFVYVLSKDTTGGTDANPQNIQVPANIHYVDTPGDTAPHTYTVFFSAPDATPTSIGQGLIQGDTAILNVFSALEIKQ